MTLTDYLPQPKIVAAALTVLGGAGVLVILRAAGVVDVDLPVVMTLLAGGGLAVGGGYMQADPSRVKVEDLPVLTDEVEVELAMVDDETGEPVPLPAGRSIRWTKVPPPPSWRAR